MSNDTKDPSKLKKSRKIEADISAMQELVGIDFKPTDPQKEAKAKFWALMYEGLQLKDPLSYEFHEIAVLIRVPAVRAWQNQPGFEDWFFNRYESEQRLESLWGNALTAMEEILLNTDPKVQGARVNVIKLLAEMRESKRQPRLLDKAIQEMSPEQLEAFIEKHAPQTRLLPVDVEAKKDKEP